MTLRLPATLIGCCLSAFLLLPSGSAVAQETGTVQGTVTSADGTALNGATVRVEGTGRGTLSGDGGQYSISDVPAGSRTVVVEYLGFQSGSREVTVPAAGTATEDFTLQPDPLSMDELIVTGTATDTRKLEASYSVTTMNEEEISRRSPRGTAELIEAVPGFHVEASGGVGGNNVFVRGIPQIGGFRFLALHEDGLPVFQATELDFLNIDELHRPDETIRTAEAVRGGTASIFASNAPGGLVNFVSRTGGEELGGVAKLSVGDYNLLRTDFNYGGPLLDADDWRFNVGGFYRFDSGIRDPGFPANRGGQISANVTKQLEDGYIRFRGKLLRDSNLWYLPIPVLGGNCLDLECDERNEDIEAIPGFDSNWGTLSTLDAGRVQVPTPQGETLEHNLQDNRLVEVRQVGGDIQLDLGDGWTARNNFRVMSGEMDLTAMVPGPDPALADDFAQGFVDDLGGTGFQYTVMGTGETITDPAQMNGNGLVLPIGLWRVTEPFSMFANEISFTKDFPEIENTLTAAFYFSDFTFDQSWNFNDMLADVRGGNGRHPRILNLQVAGTPEGAVDVTDNGFLRYGGFYRDAASSGHTFVGWIQDEYSPADRVSLDLGVRLESRTLRGNTERLGSFDLGGPTLADDDVTWGTGEFKSYSFNYDEIGVSGGVNVDILPDRLAVFGRATEGYRTPDFDAFVAQTGPGPIARAESEEVTLVEAGVKYSSPTVGAFVTGFFTTIDNTPFSDIVIDQATGDLVNLDLLLDSDTYGVEAEVVLEPVPGARLDLTTTLQNPEIDNVRFGASPVGGITEEDLAALDGNRVRRIPEVMVTAAPSYEASLPGDRALRVFGSWRFVNDRFADFAQTNLLPDYNRFNVGLDFDISPQVSVESRVQNLTNSVGLTEGNPRAGQVLGAGFESLRMARPLLGRSGQVSLVYRL